jgi:hypothetical protein
MQIHSSLYRDRAYSGYSMMCFRYLHISFQARKWTFCYLGHSLWKVTHNYGTRPWQIAIRITEFNYS